MRWRSEATSAMRARRQKKPGAERERSASTQAMPMQKWEAVHASDEMKCAWRRLQQFYDAQSQKGNKRVLGSKR
eukprot:2092504-Pleurochrysis_carterae.AAC.1